MLFLCKFSITAKKNAKPLATTTTTNSIGIPFALSKTGLVVGILLLVLVAYLTDKSLRMIVDLASFHPHLHQLGVLTYEDLARIPFGRFGSGFVLIAMFGTAYGAMVAYLLIIKDNVPAVSYLLFLLSFVSLLDASLDCASVVGTCPWRAEKRDLYRLLLLICLFFVFSSSVFDSCFRVIKRSWG